MLSTLRESSEVFEKRFPFNALLPVAVVLPATLVAVLACAGALAPTLSQLAALPVVTQVLLALGGLAAIWLFAGIVASQWRGITRVFEGYPLMRYWPRRFGVACPGITRHRQRQQDARKDATPPV